MFFSTHLIDEIENAANRVAIIEAGRTIYEGGLTDLGNSVACFRLPLTDSASGATGSSPLAIDYALTDKVQLLQQRHHHDGIDQVLRFPDGIPSDLALAPGWQYRPISLEDVFIAMVSAQPYR